MDYKEIVKRAWEITHDDENHELFPYGFIPSFFGMIIGVIYVTYQIYAFRHSPLFASGAEAHFNYLAIILPIWDFLKNNPSLAVFFILIAFLVFIMYTISPIISAGALIDLITKKYVGKPVSGGFSKGLSTFFPILEFATLTSSFGVTTFLTEGSLVIRNFGTGTWLFLIPVLSFVLIVGIFLSLLFVFAEQFIVLDNDNMIRAMKKSSFMVLTNVRDIFFLGVTLAIIAARVFLNIFIILLIPLLFIGIVALMASFALKWIGIIIGMVIGIAVLIAGAYLMAGFHIFSYAVWTISFIEFRKKEIAEKNTGYLE